jgi:hypothetical protein
MFAADLIGCFGDMDGASLERMVVSDGRGGMYIGAPYVDRPVKAR